MTVHARIVCDPKVMLGKPVIRGTRVPVETILRWLGKGMSVEELLGQFPVLKREDVLAAQAYAADFLAEEKTFVAAE
jgi:uncharacterized protein (DUF433 family)